MYFDFGICTINFVS